MPLPSTRVVHPRWAEHHAPVATGTMNATCQITTAGTPGGWDPTTGPTPGTPPVVSYTGPCRVQYEATQPRVATAADQPVTVRTVLAALPAGSAPQADGALLTVTAVDANGPTALVGRTLTVRASTFSSLAVEQDLTCLDDQTNQPEV